MKKIALFIVSVLSVVSYAQQAYISDNMKAKVQPSTLSDKQVSVRNMAGQKVVLPEITKEMLSGIRKAAPNELNKVSLKAPKQLNEEADNFYALFEKPEGTFFCGIDEAGSYIWFNFPSLVGSWRNGLDTWTYKNACAGADKIQWSGYFYNMYPELYGTDANNNLVDTIIEYWPWSGRPLLPGIYASRTVDNEIQKDSFVLMGYPGEPIDTTITNSYVWNNGVNPLDDNGFFPLTNAMVYNMKYGSKMSFANVWSSDKATQTWSYIYGTKPVTYKGEEGDVTFQPSTLFVVYDKPQAPLFINDITVALDAIKFDTDSDDFVSTAVSFSQLGIQILSADFKTVLATSTCSINDTTNNAYVPGCMAHFYFQEKDEYGMVLSEGITVNEPFVVALVGLAQEGANFGVMSSYNPYYYCKTAVLDDAKQLHSFINSDPYIMLNGTFYTLEDFSELVGEDNYSDTINMNVEYEDGYYYLVHADGGLKGYSDEYLAASEMLYDTTTYNYNYEITAPDWVNIIDMEWVFETQNGDLDIWEDYNAFALYIQGAEANFETDTELPKIGDEIKLKKFGREIVFKVVGGKAQGVEQVNTSNNKSNVRKVVRDGQVLIMKGNKKFNVLGTRL